MAYELIVKSPKGKNLPNNCISISRCYIALSINLRRAFVSKKYNKMTKLQYGIFYYDKRNKKLKITPSDNYLAGFVYRKGFQNPSLIKRINLPSGVFYAEINKNGEIEISLNKRIVIR